MLIPAGRQEYAEVFGAICFLSFLIHYSRVAFAPLVDLFIQAGSSPVIAGLLPTAVWVGSALPRLPTGYLLTFFNRHRVLIWVAGWLTVGAIIVVSALSVELLIGGAIFLGLASGAYFIAANPLVSELYPKFVGQAMGIRGMFAQIGAVTAPFIVGFSIAFWNWRVAFVGLSIAAFACTVWLLVSTRHVDLPTAGRDDRELIKGIRTEWRLVIAGIIFVGVTGFVWQGVFNFYVTFLNVEKGLSASIGTQVLTLTFAAGVPAFWLFGRLADKYSFLLLIFFILTGFAGALILLTITESLTLLIVVSVILGFLIHGLFPVNDAYLLASMPDHHRASAYAGYSAVMMAVQAPGSVFVGIFAQIGLSYGQIFRSYAVIVLLITVGMYLLSQAGIVPSGRSNLT